MPDRIAEVEAERDKLRRELAAARATLDSIRNHLRDWSIELDQAATRLAAEVESAPSERAAPVLAAAQAYWGCANRLRIIFVTHESQEVAGG
jgi:hypothetical protein